MQQWLLELLRCPVTKTHLQLQVISQTKKIYNGQDVEIIFEGILFAEEDWFYPIINGIPRLLVEAFIDYREFLSKHLMDYNSKRQGLEEKYSQLILNAVIKNKRTKKSFAAEWNIFNYEKDKTWDAHQDEMMQRFLRETLETKETLQGKLIFDAGCGNGLLNQLIAKCGAVIVGMDLGINIERAHKENTEINAVFIQGDVQYPPLANNKFDIVNSSGVLHHTNNTELSLSKIEPCVKAGGKLSIWLYHPRKNFIHNLFNTIRRGTSKLPIKMQYYLYAFTLVPASFIIKRLKGKKQNLRETTVKILDWFSPEFRWEHTTEEAKNWFHKRGYSDITITTTDTFGFNILGIKNSSVNL